VTPTDPTAQYLRTLAPGSRRAQRQAIDVLEYEMHPHTWETLDRDAVLGIQERLIDRYAPATVRRIMAALTGVLRECWLLEQIDKNRYLTLVTKLPAVKGTRVAKGRALTPAESAALIGAAATVRDRTLIATMLATGMRREEAASVRLDDIATYHDANGHALGVCLRVVGKGDKERNLYISGAAAAAPIAALRDEGYEDDRHTLFGLTSSGVAKVITKAAKKAGIQASCHDLRRTYATRALNLGIDVLTVQKALGHADPRTTSRYDRRGDDAQRKAAELTQTAFPA
jgi:integrase